MSFFVLILHMFTKHICLISYSKNLRKLIENISFKYNMIFIMSLLVHFFLHFFISSGCKRSKGNDLSLSWLTSTTMKVSRTHQKWIIYRDSYNEMEIKCDCFSDHIAKTVPMVAIVISNASPTKNIHNYPFPSSKVSLKISIFNIAALLPHCYFLQHEPF